MSLILLIAGLGFFGVGIIFLLKSRRKVEFRFMSSVALILACLIFLLRLYTADPNEESFQKDQASFALVLQVETKTIGAQFKTLFESGRLKSLVVFATGEFEKSSFMEQSCLDILRESLGPYGDRMTFKKRANQSVAKMSDLTAIIETLPAGQAQLFIGGINADVDLDPDELNSLAESRCHDTWLCTASGNPKLQKSLLDAGVIDLVFKPVVKVGTNNQITCECQVFSK